MNLLKTINLKYYSVLFLILALAFALRIYDINYNSPSIDEAIYVIIGRLGLFQNDWWSYNPSTWLAGLPYLYPSVAAVTYVIGGITGSRIFNIILSIFLVKTVFSQTLLLNKSKNESHKIMAAAIAAIICAGSTIGIVVSRLATYDIPSFYFFMLSVLYLLKAESNRNNIGRYYFYSASFLVVATLTKIIIGVYIPIIFIYSFITSRRLNRSHKSFWIKYFALPLVFGFGIYILTNFSSLLTYATANTARDKEPYINILTAAWMHTRYVWGFWIIATIGLLLKKDWKIWISYTLLSILVLLPHFLSQRAIWTMEKQTFLTIALLSPIIGIGTMNLVTFIKYRSIRGLAYVLLSFLIAAFLALSFLETLRYNSLWQDTRPFKEVIRANVYPGEKILSESGTPFILESYDLNYPFNITTFEYFKYGNKQGTAAYTSAVQDGYFDLIQLNGNNAISTSKNSLRGIVLDNLGDNYKLVYSKKNYVMYKRTY